jgi:hypothetical protein
MKDLNGRLQFDERIRNGIAFREGFRSEVSLHEPLIKCFFCGGFRYKTH